MRRMRFLDGLPGPALSAALAATMIAAGAAVGPDGVGGLGGACLALGLLAAFGALPARSLRSPRPGLPRDHGHRDLRAELMALEDRGWLVSRVLPDTDADFLVHSPTVTFLIDAAPGEDESGAAPRLGERAAWARARYGQTHRIVSILCAREVDRPRRLGLGAYRVAPPELVNFLLDRG